LSTETPGRLPPVGEAAAPPEGLSIRALFDEAAGRRFDEKRALLASSDPRRWQEVAFPVELALELASVCNLACIMCPVPTTNRPRLLMAETLFRQVIDEIATERGYVLLPQGFGESLLHPRWADLLGYARERGIAPIVMLTNGMLLDERNVARLLALELDAVVVSIDGVDPATYASVRVGGNLLAVEANVRRLLAARGTASRPRLALRIVRMNETAMEIEAFFAKWRPLLGPRDEIAINEFNNWAGKVKDRAVARPLEPTAPASAASRPPCRMLWSNLSVHADGKVSACCHDSEDELIVGNLASGDSVRGIWSGEALARLRTIHVERRLEELPICLACRNWA
jgi:radical SAM protein with 4Fe4S-binding SPASM domain